MLHFWTATRALLDRRRQKDCPCPVPRGLTLDRELSLGFFLGHFDKGMGAVHLLLEADHWVVDGRGGVHFMTVHKPRPDVKHLILSATAEPFLYKHIFGDTVRCAEIPPTQLRGNLHMHPEKSFSKQSIEKEPDAFTKQVIDDQKKYGFGGIVTHKYCVEATQQGHVLGGTQVPVLAWFGGLEGLNSFSGRSFGVYGTPHPPQYVIQLHAAACGIDVDPGWKFKDGPVCRNGFEYPFYLYSDNPEVHKIQLGLIESQITQAVGRARLVSQDTTVHLFSRILLRGGELLGSGSLRLAA